MNGNRLRRYPELTAKRTAFATRDIPVQPSPKTIAQMEKHASDAARLLKHLAHESRLLVLCLLWEKEMTVGEINERVCLSQSALSQHLALLREEGLVSCRRQSQNILYKLADPKASQILALLHELYCRKGGKKH